MLSAFTARPIIELRQRDKSKIESIIAYGDRILVGLNSGNLRVYRLNESTSTQIVSSSVQQTNGTALQNDDRPPVQYPNKPTDLLREVEKFSNKAIEQLAIIKEANVLISLSNYQVSIHDLQSYELIESLPRTKNASCFAVTSNIVKDPDTGIPEIISRLAVAAKRRLLLWNWHESELCEDVTEILLSESIRSVTWASATKIICGMNGGYVMADALTQTIEDIVSPGTVGASGQGSRFGTVSSAGMGYMGLSSYMPKPLAAKLAGGEILLAKDINTLFVDDDGKALNRRQIPWQSLPESIGYSYPYIVALPHSSKGSLEVRNPDTLSLLQTISLAGAAQLHFPPPTVSLAHAGKGFHISSERCVWKMGATDYDSQVAELVSASRFDEAISVLQMLEDALLKNKAVTLREVKILKAEFLFGQKRFRQAMDLMNDDDVHAPPERVLRMYPPLIAGDLSKWVNYEEIREKHAHSAMADDGVLPSSSDTAADQAESQSASGFVKLFKGTQRKSSPDVVSVSSKKDGDADDSDQSKESWRPDEKPITGKELMNAVLELNSYLAGTRARLQRAIDPATGKLKPQTGHAIIVEDRIGNVQEAARAETEIETERRLRGTFQLVDTTLFRAYMFSQPSLAGSLFRIPNFCDPTVVEEKLIENNRYTELIDFFFGKKMHESALELLRRFGAAPRPDEAAPALHGPDRTIQYLQSLPSLEIDLILEHAAWVLKASPEYAMEIFVGDTENAENLPRERVVHFLRELDPDLEARYLEHIIYELHDMFSEFHNRLVELYVRNLTQADKVGAWPRSMEKLVAFLQESRQVYSLTRAFALIPKDDPAFFEAQAVVLSNMGQHRQALEIYVFKMKDYDKAEEYCNRIHRAQFSGAISTEFPNEVTLSIYHSLLSLYLQPPTPHKPNLEPALDLLSKHGSRLPATSTLGLIPGDLPVGALEAYFRGRIRAANTWVNESRIEAGLRKAEGICVAARLHLGDGQPKHQGGRNRHITITDEGHCVVCHKKLSGGMRVGGSVVTVLADNTVVHYGCLNRATGTKSDFLGAPPSWGNSV